LRFKINNQGNFIQRKEKYEADVLAGKMTVVEMAAILEKDPAHVSFLQKKEKETRLLIGAKNLPQSRNDLWSSINPYELDGNRVENVGQQPVATDVKFAKIR
jgi:hypothetical protein